jgi:5-methyltetrahydropteroyltriglutamate--homocysteine methyltransferase
MTIPSPAVLHFRGGRKSISKQVYPDLEPFFEDLGKTYRKAVKAFYDAGCRYLQFDDTVWAYLCSQDELNKGARARRQSRWPAGNLRARDQLRDRRAAGRHDDHHACLPRQFPLHLDFVRRLRAGGGDHAGRHQLRRLFPRIRFRPRRRLRAAALLPKGNKIVVVGVITSKTGELEKEGRHQAAAEEAANSRRWSSSRCRRNAALPRPRRATSSPRKSSGPS